MTSNKNSKHVYFVYTTDYFAISKVGKDQYLKNIVIMGISTLLILQVLRSI